MKKNLWPAHLAALILFAAVNSCNLDQPASTGKIQKKHNAPSQTNQEVLTRILKKFTALELHQNQKDQFLQTLENTLAKTENALQGIQFPDEKMKTAVLSAYERGDFDQAGRLLEALRNKETLPREGYINLTNSLGDMYYLDLNFDAALKAYLNISGLAPWNSSYLNKAGNVFHQLGEYEKAIAHYEKALAVDMKTVGPDHVKTAHDWSSLDLGWKALGAPRKAVEYYEKALAVDLKVFGPDHANVAVDWNNLGVVWKELGEYRKAIEYYEKALAVDLKFFGPEHPKVSIRLNNLGSAWYSSGEYHRAIEYYEKALAVGLKVFGPDHPKVAALRNNLDRAWQAYYLNLFPLSP